ncbi:uncharacterized protein At3g27210-like [Cucurbita pepo subsp. pepo]|uniref:uncharacterized protein At3g27210-like n=1 Tax=Cucurbita pepo subsp. pepo TaxID=3664 RepID=UPI000C9D301F|nr:uncharacterized protein At3g27210-like [Cucurbita pepo subsp. pepo]
MGSCVSIHRNSDSAVKFRLSNGSKPNGLPIPPSPIKDNDTPIIGNPPIHGGVFVKSQSSPSHFGSKDEAFFDSRGWLDSDCEDDFYSVNGDFTPSRGNTPVRTSFSSGTPRINQVHVVDDLTPIAMPKPSPTGKKKLAELFRDSSRNGTDIQTKPTLNELALQSNPETPYMSGTNSVCSSERTSNGGDVWIEKEKRFGSAQCCLPSLGSRRSFGDRRKKASPAIAV